jgi:hypothetical protein
MIYSIAQRATNITTAQAAFDVASPTASGVLALITELGIFLGAATASTYGIARTTTLGTRTTPAALIAEAQNMPALTGITLIDSAIAWSAQPTISAVDFRRIGLPATIGTGVIWTFPRGIQLQAQLAVAVVNRATNSAATDCYAVVDV